MAGTALVFTGRTRLLHWPSSGNSVSSGSCLLRRPSSSLPSTGPLRGSTDSPREAPQPLRSGSEIGPRGSEGCIGIAFWCLIGGVKVDLHLGARAADVAQWSRGEAPAELLKQ